MSDMINSMLWAPYLTGQSNAPAEEFAVSRNPNSTLDKDAFLQLLVTQLKYQDPLNPLDDKEFLAQMAQFTALEQMQNMNQTTTKSQAYSMIGKNIVAETYNPLTYTTEEISGLVTSVIVKGSVPLLVVGGVEVPVSDVVEVYEPYHMQTIYNSMATSQNMALIGKYIQAITVDKDFNPTGFVEGKVDSVRFTNGQTILLVGGKEVFAPEVISVADEMTLIGKEVTFMRNVLDEYFEEKGIVTSVKFLGNDSYLVINGKDVKVDKLNYVSEARSYIGREVNVDKISGVASEIVIRDTLTLLKVITKEAGEESEEEYELVPFTKIRGS